MCHRFVTILFINVCKLISDCEDGTKIVEDVAEDKKDSLSNFAYMSGSTSPQGMFRNKYNKLRGICQEVCQSQHPSEDFLYFRSLSLVTKGASA